MANETKRVPELRFSQFDKEWKKTTIADIGEFYYGRSAPKWSITDDATIPCVRYGELYTKHKGTVKEIYSYTNIDRNKLRFSKGGEILIPRVGEDPMDFAKCSYLPFSGVAIGEMISVYNTDQNPVFITAYFNSQMKYEFAKRVEGASVSNLYYSYLKDINLRIPTIEEQQKIGEFFSKLDRQIELEEEKLELLEQQKRGYMQKIFSQEVRFKDDNGNSYPEWESAPLFDIFSATKGKSLSKDKISDDGKYECILYGEIYTTYEEKIESIVSRTNYYEGILSQKNDLIFPNSTTTNAWDLATFSSLQKNNVLIGGDISILRTKRSDISSLFYAYYLTNYLKLRKDIAKYAQGITIVHLSFNNFCKIKVQIPSLEEQNSITDFIDTLNQQQKLIANKIKLLKERKQGLLQKMFV
ncbi:restriction endonuclease subunit S [Shewanella baltica]|uniref:restriction endonuclease subunit S n=1 Tax=Shewanella baltica TaxID=62322 RepID=UPI003CFDA72E